MKNASPEKTDTTGCGDNFAGGVYASTIRQISENRPPLSLKKAAVSGIIAGGFAGLYLGGVYHEQYSGEKTRKLVPFLTEYRYQTGENYE